MEDSSLAIVFEKVFLTLALWMSAFLILRAVRDVYQLIANLNKEKKTYFFAYRFHQVGWLGQR